MSFLSQAYKLGFYGPKIVWIFLGYLSETFWRTRLESTDCTVNEMNQAADGIFLIKLTEDGSRDKRGIANITCK